MSRNTIFLISLIFLISMPLIAEEPVAEGSLVQDEADIIVEEGQLTKESSPRVASPTVNRSGKYLIRSTKAEYGEPVEKDEGALTSRIANEFVDKLTSSQFNEASKYFDATMKKKMPTRFLRKNWLTLLRGSGDFESKGKDWVSATDVYQVSHIPVLLGEKQVVLRVVVNDEKVSGLYIGLPWPNELSEQNDVEDGT